MMVDYLIRVLPGLILLWAVLLVLRASAPLRPVLHIAAFILARDTMTPVGLWRFGSVNWFVFIRLS